jgi:hypothetical protein
MALAAPAPSRAGITSRHGFVPSTTVAAGSVALTLALLGAALGWHGADTPNYLFRIDLFRQAGFAVWNLAWYGGHYTLGYSALLAPLGAAVGPTALGAAAAAGAAVCFDRLLERGLDVVGAARRRAATLIFAAGTVTNLAVGRLAFAVGLAAGMAAVLAATRRRWRTAFALSIVTTLASPVAGAFLAIAWLAAAVSRRPAGGRGPLACGAAALAPVVLAAALFPEDGVFPFQWTGLAAVLAACATTLVAVPVRYRVVRRGAVLYAAVAVVAFAVATPLGANVERLGMYVVAPVLVAVAPRAKVRLVAVAVPLLLLWQWTPALDGIARAGNDRSTDPAYFQPLLDFVHDQPTVVGRIEIPFTEHHYEAAYVAPSVGLARGWERQLDMLDNPIFYAPQLDAVTYHQWLLDAGVELVALPDVALDPSAAAEADVIAGRPAYLRPVWHDAHWQVWRVVDSPGLVSGPVALVATDPTSVALDATGAGTALLRVHWTPYWSAAGPACVAPAADGWTQLRVDGPGRVELGTALVGATGHCDR